jgi:hypothetical protein
MRASIAFLLALALSVVPALAQSSKAKTFDIYVMMWKVGTPRSS